MPATNEVASFPTVTVGATPAIGAMSLRVHSARPSLAIAWRLGPWWTTVSAATRPPGTPSTSISDGGPSVTSTLHRLPGAQTWAFADIGRANANSITAKALKNDSRDCFPTNGDMA